MSRPRLVGAVVAVVVGALLAVSLAQAAPSSSVAAADTGTTTSSTTATTTTTPNAPPPGSASALFGCRAGVVPLYLGSATTPLIDVGSANEATSPCYNASSTVGTVPLQLDELNLNLGTVGPASAYTYEDGAAGSATQPGVAAVANIQAVNLNLGSGVTTIVGPVQADAAIECQDNKPVIFGQSTLKVVYYNGQKTVLPPGSIDYKINVGAGIYIEFDQQIKTATSIEENTIVIHLADGLEVIVGQAYAQMANANSCANTEPTSTTTTSTTTSSSGSAEPNLNECPSGTVLDIPIGECVIYGPGGQIIVVSKPFHGPTGGVVLTIGEAIKKYGTDPCLRESGLQNWVLVATARGNRVSGTPYSDRILALGGYERVAGLGGNDCIWGKGGNQTIFDGNGKDRIYVGRGHNRVGVGNGNNWIDGSYIEGANGTDWITDGNGNNTIWGGKLASRLDDGLGHDQVHAGPKADRIYIAGGDAKVQCGTGKDVLYARSRTAAYGLKHGCESVHYLRAKV